MSIFRPAQLSTAGLPWKCDRDDVIHNASLNVMPERLDLQGCGCVGDEAKERRSLKPQLFLFVRLQESLR